LIGSAVDAVALFATNLIVGAAAAPVVAEVATTVASAVPGLEVPAEIVDVDEESAIFESAVTVIVHTNGAMSLVPGLVPFVPVAV